MYKNSLKAGRVAVFMTAAVFTGPGALAGSNSPLTVIAIDISESSPFLSEQGAADRLARFTKDYISTLEPGHRISITTLGLPGFTAQIDLTATVGNRRQEKAQVLANGAADVVRSIPGRYETGEFPGQAMTSILDFLEGFASHDCTNTPTEIIIAGDGVEWTETFDGPQFMAGNIQLPEPQAPYLEGCTVTMLGVGNTVGYSTDRLFQRLQPQWEQYLAAAGAVNITIAGKQIGY